MSFDFLINQCTLINGNVVDTLRNGTDETNAL